MLCSCLMVSAAAAAARHEAQASAGSPAPGRRSAQPLGAPEPGAEGNRYPDESAPPCDAERGSARRRAAPGRHRRLLMTLSEMLFSHRSHGAGEAASPPAAGWEAPPPSSGEVRGTRAPATLGTPRARSHQRPRPPHRRLRRWLPPLPAEQRGDPCSRDGGNWGTARGDSRTRPSCAELPTADAAGDASARAALAARIWRVGGDLLMRECCRRNEEECERSD